MRLLKRRWLRFSLATLIALVTLAAFACKLFFDRIRTHASQYGDLAALTDLSFDEFRDSFPPGPWAVGECAARGGGTVGFVLLSPAAGWVKEAADYLGIRYDVDVVALSLRGDREDLPHEIKVASRLPKLKSLGISASELTEDSLAVVASMRCLESLSFSETRVDDNLLNALKRMDWLEELNFGHDTNIMREDVNELRRIMPTTRVSVSTRGPVRIRVPAGTEPNLRIPRPLLIL